MKEIFEEMENMGWNGNYANNEYLDFDYNNLEEFYLDYIDKNNKNKDIKEYIIDNDILASLGFILDFVKVVRKINNKEEL